MTAMTPESVERDDLSWLVKSLREKCECNASPFQHQVCDLCQGASAVERQSAALVALQAERDGLRREAERFIKAVGAIEDVCHEVKNASVADYNTAFDAAQATSGEGAQT